MYERLSHLKSIKNDLRMLLGDVHGARTDEAKRAFHIASIKHHTKKALRGDSDA